MTRLLARLRLHARALIAIAAIAMLLPSFAPGPGAAAPPSLVVCTAEGLVSIPLGDAPAAHKRELCAACLRADLPTLPPPPVPLPLPPASNRAEAAPAPVAPSPPLRPDTPPARAPPAFA